MELADFIQSAKDEIALLGWLNTRSHRWQYYYFGIVSIYLSENAVFYAYCL
ncbi:hypothetical protein [Nostoc sp. UHCC 0252]|uniref:hypothetical protein n=1 Tax=Nostoc sp. UHCC 0252 TaxID=3110241 RepID=UPI002B1F4253|nr:hypothetical protein [Nostoc sp. UHCC 0252]MEA5602698.1 hypothetical protein [Nostoc sp. UHCC 0252]